MSDLQKSGRVQLVLSGIYTLVPLPDIASVRRDAARVAFLTRPEGRNDREIIVIKDSRTGNLMTNLPKSAQYHAMLQNLFTYSFFVHTDDVPEDLLGNCIWALEMFIRELNECTAEQLRAIGHITRNTPDHNLGSAMESLRLNTKLKVAVHLLKPAIDRPVDAAVYLVEVIDFVKRTSHGADPFVKQREIFLIFAGALVRSGTNDKDAQAILERLAQINDASMAGLKALVTTKVYLARVLRRREKTKAAEKHEEWLTKWFRKNPHLISEHALRLLLLPPGETGGSPVLDALGGPSWLDSRQHTDKTDLRLAKQCRQCGACEPMTKLAVCSKCKKFYYCSRDCQKANWQYHKNGCQDYALLNEQLAALSMTDSSAAQKQKDFHGWLDVVDHWPYVSALSLHRDQKRGRKHMIFEEVAYTPKAGTEARDKFRVVRCGVFRMTDVYSEIERKMCLDPGEGPKFCKDLLDEMDASSNACGRVPFLVMVYGEGAGPRLGNDGIGQGLLHSRPYDPEWRKAMNPDLPPAQIQVAAGTIKDSEHDV